MGFINQLITEGPHLVCSDHQPSKTIYACFKLLTSCLRVGGCFNHPFSTLRNSIFAGWIHMSARWICLLGTSYLCSLINSLFGVKSTGLQVQCVLPRCIFLVEEAHEKKSSIHRFHQNMFTNLASRRPPVLWFNIYLHTFQLSNPNFEWFIPVIFLFTTAWTNKYVRGIHQVLCTNSTNWHNPRKRGSSFNVGPHTIAKSVCSFNNVWLDWWYF